MSKAIHTVWRAGFKNIEVMETDEHVAAAIRVTCGNGDFTKRISRIIAEAGNAHEQTGMTPRQLVEQREMLRNVLDAIGGLSRALRVGGPDPMDLQGLSDALSDAVDMAHSALAETEIKK
jgi:hypothetical protein